MALGQVQPASTGTRPGGGVQRATPYRTTPLPPSPVTPLNTGRPRAPDGMNASMGQVRADRGRMGTPIQQGGPAPLNAAPRTHGPRPQPMNAGRVPARTRALRPLVMDRMAPQPTPQPTPQQPNVNAAPPAFGISGRQYGQQMSAGAGAGMGMGVGARLMPRTQSAVFPTQPQPRGPFAPTPATYGAGFQPQFQSQPPFFGSY